MPKSRYSERIEAEIKKSCSAAKISREELLDTKSADPKSLAALDGLIDFCYRHLRMRGDTIDTELGIPPGYIKPAILRTATSGTLATTPEKAADAPKPPAKQEKPKKIDLPEDPVQVAELVTKAGCRITGIPAEQLRTFEHNMQVVALRYAIMAILFYLKLRPEQIAGIFTTDKKNYGTWIRTARQRVSTTGSDAHHLMERICKELGLDAQHVSKASILH